MTTRVGIVGAGLIGSTAALGLAELGFQVTLIEQRAPSRSRGKLGIDVRNVALSPASKQLLDRFNVWPQDDLCTYTHMQVWEHWGTSVMSFDAPTSQQEALGWVVENSALTQRLWRACSENDSIEVVQAGLTSVNLQTNQVHVILQGQDNVRQNHHKGTGQTHTFDLLIGADGGRSKVRELLAVDHTVYAVNQAALATVVRTAKPHQNTAWQRFLSDGPVAFLPSKDAHVCSVVWSQPEDLAQQRAQLDEAAFCQQLSAALEYQLGEVEAVDERFIFPLQQQLACSANPHPQVLLIGDAYRVVHPLAGLGVNLGFEDIQSLLNQAKNFKVLLSSSQQQQAHQC